MPIMKIIRKYRCYAMVVPGEYVISKWDYKRCEETNPKLLIQCEFCGHDFCLALHWHKHNHNEEIMTL